MARVGVGERPNRTDEERRREDGNREDRRLGVSTVGWVAEAVSAASAMMAEPIKVVVEPPSSSTVTV